MRQRNLFPLIKFIFCLYSIWHSIYGSWLQRDSLHQYHKCKVSKSFTVENVKVLIVMREYIHWLSVVDTFHWLCSLTCKMHVVWIQSVKVFFLCDWHKTHLAGNGIRLCAKLEFTKHCFLHTHMKVKKKIPFLMYLYSFFFIFAYRSLVCIKLERVQQ